MGYVATFIVPPTEPPPLDRSSIKQCPCCQHHLHRTAYTGVREVCRMATRPGAVDLDGHPGSGERRVGSLVPRFHAADKTPVTNRDRRIRILTRPDRRASHGPSRTDSKLRSL